MGAMNMQVCLHCQDQPNLECCLLSCGQNHLHELDLQYRGMIRIVCMLLGGVGGTPNSVPTATLSSLFAT